MSSEEVSHTISMHQILELGDDMSLPDDVEILNKKVDEKLSARCFWDVMMGAFIIRLFKSADNLETGIGLRIDALRHIMIVFPRLDALATRYLNRDMYMSYKYQIANMVYLTVGQNSPKYGGKKYIDIREHFPADDSVKLIPTRNGIRFPLEILQKFKAAVKICLEETSHLMKKSSDLFNEVKLFLVERDVRSIRFLENICHDCSIDHVTAMRHKKRGLCKDVGTWTEIVDQCFNDAVKGVNRANIIRLATRVSKRMGELAFISEEIKETTDEELKRSLKAIVRINKGTIYKHMTDIIEEEEELEQEKKRQMIEEEETDILSEEEIQPKKKKIKVQEEEEEEEEEKEEDKNNAISITSEDSE